VGKFGLVVLDPPDSYFEKGIDINNYHHVRLVLDPLADVANRTGATVLMVRHLNKATGKNRLYRGNGSIALAATCRSYLQVNGGKLGVVKANYGQKAGSISYQIIGTEINASDERGHEMRLETAIVQWSGPTKAGPATGVVGQAETPAPGALALTSPSRARARDERVLNALQALGGDADYLEVRKQVELLAGVSMSGRSYARAVTGLEEQGEVEVYVQGTRRRLKISRSLTGDSSPLVRTVRGQ
jgi:hypothetical protein